MKKNWKSTAVISAMSVAATIALSSSAAFAATTTPVLTESGWTQTVLATAPAGLQQPDDITMLNQHLYVSYQNHIQGDGLPGKTGGPVDSGIVEYSLSGKMINKWMIKGHCDGLQADPKNNRLIATVNEDNNSSLYLISPNAASGKQVQHETYAVNPAVLMAPSPKFATGGTDGIVVKGGQYYISASSPAAGTNGMFKQPAMFHAVIKGAKVVLSTALPANAMAKNAVTGLMTKLNISDPDSSFLVPAQASMFANDVAMISQNDAEVIFMQNIGTSQQTQTVVPLGTNLNDLAWITSTHGTLYMTDSVAGKIYKITGNFTKGTVLATSPHDAGVGPFLGQVDLTTGIVKPIGIGYGNPQGMIFVK